MKAKKNQHKNTLPFFHCCAPVYACLETKVSILQNTSFGQMTS